MSKPFPIPSSFSMKNGKHLATLTFYSQYEWLIKLTLKFLVNSLRLMPWKKGCFLETIGMNGQIYKLESHNLVGNGSFHEIRIETEHVSESGHIEIVMCGSKVICHPWHTIWIDDMTRNREDGPCKLKDCSRVSLIEPNAQRPSKMPSSARC